MNPKCSNCYSMVSEWKCAECDPYAGRFYASTENCDRDTRLKLCRNYCLEIFNVCKDIPFSLDKNPFYLNDPVEMTAEEFCENHIAAEPNCFSGSVPNKIDSQCICLDHMCHLEVEIDLDTEF